ncbi:MAG: flagellar biosynthesis protein FlhF [Aliivibrio sp.]|uniref:flagellar biosynthesis protein FlhF n=1 Tax=Aliivibrio sp. TaxID=1872443 RepID=UPI001A3FEC54|nr:flagellar biosynthesis protein FlhF [Aliivibrio sp.]
MKIKRFFAKDMRTALVQVKEELGVDAVIMSNKKVTGGVEIVAAIDPDHQSSGLTSTRSIDNDRVSINSDANNQSGSMTRRFSNMLKQYGNNSNASDRNALSKNQANEEREEDSLTALLQRQSKYQHSGMNPYSENANISNAASQNPTLSALMKQERQQERQKPKLDPSRFERHDKSSNNQNSDDLEKMRAEMTSIRRLLEHQVSGLMWQEVERREPLRAMLISRLIKMGISEEHADQLACYIPEELSGAEAWSALLNLLADQIVTTKEDLLQQGGVVALLGPTGVGKTTTIAKLAARAAMDYGPDQVALVTTDTFRIGASEQLAIYGRILGCPVRIAKDADELADVIYQLRNRKLILVDTAGIGQRDIRLSEQLDTLMLNNSLKIKSYLVLPSTCQLKVLQETVDHFKRIPLSGCILTKLDESLSLGELISVIVQNSLPIAYLANGQRVPEDIVLAQPKYLVAQANKLLKNATKNEPHFWSTDIDIDNSPSAEIYD